MTDISSAGFRDPAGRVFIRDGRVFRAVTEDRFALLQSFFSTRAATHLLENAQLVRTTTVIAGELVEHDRVPFTGYPYEWPPEMLCAAGELTLQIAEAIAGENWRLKDATPYNVLFIGPKPIFIDVLSFERREPSDMMWLAYGQFVRTFLLPLLAAKSLGLSLRDVLSTRRDGLQPDEFYALAGTFQKLKPPMLSLVLIPAWLSRLTTPNRAFAAKTADPGQASFVFSKLLRGLARKLKSVAPRENSSSWLDYSQSLEDRAYYDAKLAFVREALERYRPKTGLDVGCNTGDFSCLAAEAGVSIVAVDSDPAVVGRTWRRAIQDNLDILPLVIDITRPSPDLGWFNAECTSFLSRAHHRFEMVLFLAVMHHIADDGIPIQEFIRLADHLSARFAIIEFVDHTDPAFAEIARGREEIFSSYNIAQFEAECSSHFEIVSRRHVRPARWLYLLQKS